MRWGRLLRSVETKSVVFRGGEETEPVLRMMEFDKRRQCNFVEYWPNLKEVRCVGRSVLVLFEDDTPGQITFMVRPSLDAGEEEVVVLREVDGGVTVSSREVSWWDVWDEAVRDGGGVMEASREMQLWVGTRKPR